MKHFLKLIYSNKFIAFLMIIIQVFVIAWSFNLFGDVEDSSRYIVSFFSFVLPIGLIIFELNRHSEPTFKLTWLVIISIIPFFGVLLYLFTRLNIGNKVILKKYNALRADISKNMRQDTHTLDRINESNIDSIGIITYLKECSDSPVYQNTEVDYFELGELMIEDLKNELQKAEKFIFLEFYIINAHMNNTKNPHVWSEILEILKEKASSGIEVRLIYDGMGCLGILPQNYPQILEKMGIKCRIFSPIVPLFSTHQNNRDHRKICVIDGKTGYTGGINLADEYANRIVRFGHWKDTGIKLSGEAVSGLSAMFLHMWNLIEKTDLDEDLKQYISISKRHKISEAQGYVIPFSDTPLDDDEVGKRVYIDILNNSRKYVYITTPYLMIDYEMYEAIKYAIKRGVEVSIIMPHIPDKKYAFYLSRIYYCDLIKAGVKIYEYTEGFVHAKMSISDDTKAMVGTINHDFRSLYLQYECGVLMIDVPQIADIKNDFLNTVKKSQRITMEVYKSFPWWQRLFGHGLRLVAPLM